MGHVCMIYMYPIASVGESQGSCILLQCGMMDNHRIQRFGDHAAFVSSLYRVKRKIDSLIAWHNNVVKYISYALADEQAHSVVFITTPSYSPPLP